MEVFDAVRTILAVRRYEDRPVPQAVIRRIVEAGRLSASSMNRQPWHFVVVQDRETLHRLGELASGAPYVAHASFAIAVAIEKESKFAVSDASRAIQSMLLTAWAEGVGSNWTGFGGLVEIGTPLGVPADLDVLALLPFGYPAGAAGRGMKQRKPLDEIAHRERYGQPFE